MKYIKISREIFLDSMELDPDSFCNARRLT